MPGKTTNAVSWITYALMVALVAVTVAVMLFMYPPMARGARLYLSLGMLIFAEIQLFMMPGISRHYTTAASKPWRIAQSTVSVFYLIAVATVAALVGPESTYNALWANYLILLFLFLFFIGMTIQAAAHTQTAKSEQKNSEAWFAGWKIRFEPVIEQINLLPADGLNPLRQTCNALLDEVRYADRESLPGSERMPGITAIEEELDALLLQIASAVAAVKTGFNPEQLDGKLRQLHQLLRRRSEILRSARAG